MKLPAAQMVAPTPPLTPSPRGRGLGGEGQFGNCGRRSIRPTAVRQDAGRTGLPCRNFKKRETREAMAARPKENPRYHVLSVRVSDEERETLEKISRKANKSVSDLMREVFNVMASAALPGR